MEPVSVMWLEDGEVSERLIGSVELHSFACLPETLTPNVFYLMFLFFILLLSFARRCCQSPAIQSNVGVFALRVRPWPQGLILTQI